MMDGQAGSEFGLWRTNFPRPLWPSSHLMREKIQRRQPLQTARGDLKGKKNPPEIFQAPGGSETGIQLLHHCRYKGLIFQIG